MTEEEQIAYNVRLGVDYPLPIRDPIVGDERRKYRFLRRRGMEVPPDLEETVKTRIRKDLNPNYVDYKDDREDGDHDVDGEEEEEEGHDDYDDVDYDDDEEENDEEEEKYDNKENDDNEIENEIIRKMKMSKVEKSTGDNWYRDLNDGTPEGKTSDENSKSSTSSESTAPKTPSSTKNKWRVNL